MSEKSERDTPAARASCQMADLAQLAQRVQGALALLQLPAARAAALLAPDAPQPSVGGAADALAHEVSKLTLLVSHGQMPPWDSGAPALRALRSLATLCALKTSPCR
jgi:hypothetical protein